MPMKFTVVSIKEGYIKLADLTRFCQRLRFEKNGFREAYNKSV